MNSSSSINYWFKRIFRPNSIWYSFLFDSNEFHYKDEFQKMFLPYSSKFSIHLCRFEPIFYSYWSSRLIFCFKPIWVNFPFRFQANCLLICVDFSKLFTRTRAYANYWAFLLGLDLRKFFIWTPLKVLRFHSNILSFQVQIRTNFLSDSSSSHVFVPCRFELFDSTVDESLFERIFHTDLIQANSPFRLESMHY